jgi:peroxin-5
MYREAASHIYTALTLQATDDAAAHAPSPDAGAGVTSAALWETLRVALELLDRSDLANLTSRRGELSPLFLSKRSNESEMGKQ